MLITQPLSEKSSNPPAPQARRAWFALNTEHIKIICRHSLTKKKTAANISEVQILSFRTPSHPLLSKPVNANMVLNLSFYPEPFEPRSLSNWHKQEVKLELCDS